MKKILIISGMSCINCVKHLREALEEDIDGVKVIDISLESKSAEIEVEESVTDNNLEVLIDELGYKLESIQ